MCGQWVTEAWVRVVGVEVIRGWILVLFFRLDLQDLLMDHM